MAPFAITAPSPTGAQAADFAQTTLGRHIGSPINLLPVETDQGWVLTFNPGYCGHVFVYSEMTRGPTKFFMWFALPDGAGTPAPDGYDQSWGFDYGFGSFNTADGNNAFHATFVLDQYTSNGQTNPDGTRTNQVAHVAHDPARTDSDGFAYWMPPTAGTMANPGRILSANPTATTWPQPWGTFTAGHLTNDFTTAYFLVLSGIVLDVPMVEEASWDGHTLFASQAGVGRTISAIGGAPMTPMVSAPETLLTKPMVGDFDGDGKTDIALWKTGFTSTPIYYGGANGQLGRVTNAQQPAGMNWINDSTANRLLGDFDGDGRTDVVMWRQGWTTIPMYRARANGGFTVTNTAEASGYNLINDAAAGKLVGDFNGDGRADIALWKPGWNSTPVYLSNGDGTFRYTNWYQLQAAINDPAARRIVADFNGDGRADILVSKAGWNSTPVYFANPDGSLRWTNYAQSFSPINDLSATPMVGDFDGDGRADVALWRAGWGSTPVYFSNGNGSFRSTNYVTNTAEVNDPQARKIVGDFNGDHRSDIVVVKRGYTSMKVYLSNANGSFLRRTATVAGNAANGMGQLIAGDFDGNGMTDFVVRSPGATSVPTYLASGAGAFQLVTTTPATNQLWISE